MTKTVRGQGGDEQAKRVAGLSPSPNAGAGGSDVLSPSLVGEIGAALDRAVRAHKAEEIARALDGGNGLNRATFYKMVGRPRRFYAGDLLALADFDPDPEFLARFAGLLMAYASHKALVRQAQGRAVMVFAEYAPGRYGR